MAWPRVDGLRALELGSPGEMRAWLNRLVLEGRKRATAGLLDEYAEEQEELEHVGERLALVGDDGARVATVEITGVERSRFADVTWDFAAAEGEDDRDLEEWRAGHRRFWAGAGTPVTDDTAVVLLRFALVDVVGAPDR
ncbi:MAG TPA: ASCH domain-containing protein [Nocardioidaceae bacterium]|nr:ASCH domain-containing protein [Nocardioidaceae bacterium]